MSNTALGNYEPQKKIELKIAASKMSKDERNKLRAQLDEFDRDEELDEACLAIIVI